MSDTSARLDLPFLAAAQAQKHVTVNEGLSRLDLIVQLVVEAFGANTPPAAPVEGQIWATGAAPTGVWAGLANRLAAWQDGGWVFVQQAEGWRAWGRAGGDIRVWQGGNWVASGLPNLQNLPGVGINTTADASNRLAVSAPATLLSHEGAGHQVKVNKAAVADTASLLFQSNFSGRAEFGLIGDNDFRLKVSGGGASFDEALWVERTSGRVRLPAGVLADGFALRDPADPSRAAVFSAAGIATATTRSYTFPDLSGELALLDGVQVFSGLKTFTGGASISGTFTVSAATALLGTATGTATYGLGTGATTTGLTKAVGIGTGGAAGSTTDIAIGSATAGALGSLTVNSPTVTFAPAVTTVTMGAATLSANLLGLGGATPDTSNRLSVNAPGILFNHAGAGVEVTATKAAAADSVLLAFKTGFSTRAQAGLLGNDDLTLRVSPDGTTFQTALVADRTSARISLPVGLALGAQASDPVSPADGWLWLNSTAGQVRGRMGARTFNLGGLDVPFLLPPVGEVVLTTLGSGTTTTTLIGVADRMEIFPFCPRADLTVDAVSINVTTAVAAALAKVVVYAADANGRPTTKILETGTLDCSTVGVKTATASLTLWQGVTYWFALRHSSTATLSVWQANATPDINGGNVTTSSRKTMRRTLSFATAAPTNWGFFSGEINAALATAIWLRMG